MIRRLGIGCVLLAALAMPAAASAEVTRSEFKNASKYCKALRAEMGVDAFRAQFGANKKKGNAFGKCVSKHARAEHRAAKKALRECKAEYTADPVAFLEKYGSEDAEAAFERPGEGERPAKPELADRPNAALREAMHKCVRLKLSELRAERRETLENAKQEREAGKEREAGES